MTSARPILHPGKAGMAAVGYREAWGNPKAVLNLGCGNDYRPGWVNMDLYAAADVTHDFTAAPWPFADASFDGVYAHHVLEHVPHTVNGRDGLSIVLAEIERVLRPGGVCSVGVPFPGSVCDLANQTHYRRFCLDSFHFLAPGSGSTLRLVYDVPSLRLAHRAVVRGIRWGPFDSAWHGERYFGRALNIGYKVGLLFVLRKVEVKPRG